MPDILIRDVDGATLVRLKRRARRHGRSLQSEAKLLIEQAAGCDDVSELLETWERRLGGRRFASSVGLIREDRDR